MPNSKKRPAALLSLDILENSLFTASTKEAFFRDRKIHNLEAAFNKLLVEENEYQLQIQLAPILRAATVRYLREGNNEYVNYVRASYNESYPSEVNTISFEELLDNQTKDKAWAVAMEVAALGSLLNITVLITPITRGQEQTIFAAYRSPDANAPVIHLYNRDDVHYFYHEGRSENTLGDGNCFYNAFAQGLRHCALKLSNKNGNKLTPSEKKLFLYQEQLLEAIKNKAKPATIPDIIAHIPDERVEAARADSESIELSSKKDIPHLKPELHSDEKNILLTQPMFEPPAGNDYAKTFYDALVMMAIEANRLKIKSEVNKSFLKAAKAAKILVADLNVAATNHYDGDMTTHNFIRTCNLAIKKAEPHLENIAGWKRIIGNIALAIVGVGIGYIVAGLIKKAMTGEFLFFQSKTTEKFKKLKTTIEPRHKLKLGK